MNQPSAGSLAGSIVIPAWNEANVIERTLEVLHDGLGPYNVQVIVACNGCTDGTAKIVEEMGLSVTVLDLPPIGKALAIRAAEQLTSALPRLYLDADTELAGASAVAVLHALNGAAIAARPPIHYDVSMSHALVRRFYRVRALLPSVSNDLCGAGVYGLSAEARSRFGDFPDVVADDLFAARIVTPNEVTIVSCPPVKVGVPRQVGDLIRTLARVYRGNRAFVASDHTPTSTQMPSANLMAPSTTGGTVRELLGLLRNPLLVVDVVIYASLVTCGRLQSRRTSHGWERDESSRQPREPA